MKYKKASLFISIAIFITIVILIAYHRAELLRIFNQTNTNWILAGFFSYFLSYCFRSYRMNLYVTNLIKIFPTSFNISALHGFSTYFMPIRLGDFALPPLLKLYCGVPVLEGTRILIRTRILDLQSLGIFLLGSVCYSIPASDVPWRLYFFPAAIFFISLPYLVTAFTQIKTFKLNHKLSWLIHKSFSNQPRLLEFSISILIWLFTGFSTFCIAKAISLKLSFIDIWFLSTVQLPLQLLPVQGLANSGNHEAGWLAALSLFGISPEEGMSFALASHLILISYVSLLGAIAALLSTSNNKNILKPVVP